MPASRPSTSTERAGGEGPWRRDRAVDSPERCHAEQGCHSPKIRRRIEKPRIILLDYPLEYKKGESQTNIEISKEADWNRVLGIEEEQVKAMCEKLLIEFKPDLVFTEKGVSGMCTNRRYEGDVVYQRAPYRSRATLSSQGQHHGTSSGAQVRQQPDRLFSFLYIVLHVDIWQRDCEYTSVMNI